MNVPRSPLNHISLKEKKTQFQLHFNCWWHAPYFNEIFSIVIINQWYYLPGKLDQIITRLTRLHFVFLTWLISVPFRIFLLKMCWRLFLFVAKYFFYTLLRGCIDETGLYVILISFLIWLQGYTAINMRWFIIVVPMVLGTRLCFERIVMHCLTTCDFYSCCRFEHCRTA